MNKINKTNQLIKLLEKYSGKKIVLEADTKSIKTLADLHAFMRQNGKLYIGSYSKSNRGNNITEIPEYLAKFLPSMTVGRYNKGIRDYNRYDEDDKEKFFQQLDAYLNKYAKLNVWYKEDDSIEIEAPYPKQKKLREAKVVELKDTDGDGIPSGKYIVVGPENATEDNGTIIKNIATKEEVEIDQDYLKKYGIQLADSKAVKSSDNYDPTSGAAPDMSEPVENTYNSILNAIDENTGLKTNKYLFHYVSETIGKQTPDFNRMGWMAKEPVKLESLKAQIESAIRILQKALDIINRVK
jgi:hypothetical protein